MTKNQFDIIVFGGGMVGAATALGFAKKGLKVAIVEPGIPEELDDTSPPDLRVSAISYGSQQLLSELGAWQFLMDSRIQPYTELAVWEHEGFATEFDAQNLGLSHLGYLLENRNLQLALHKAINQLKSDHGVQWYHKGELIDEYTGVCRLDDEQVTGKLIVAADGAFSGLRKQTRMGETGWKYQQSVFTIAIKTEKPSLQKTFQQFSANGPMAYLPLFDHYAALVWYTPDAHIRQLKTLSKEGLAHQVKQSFPEIHSDFVVLNSASFPIRRNHANRYYKGRTVLCGDSAHAINPLAGQGVNIGFQDVRELIKIQPTGDLDEQLKAFESSRKPQNLLMMSTMDGFNSAFSNNNPLVMIGRNLGLKLANHAGPLKDMALKKALGI